MHILDDNKIIGGLGIIDNDFHERKDLSPNICALYVEKDYRNKGIASKLLNIAITDMKNKGITPIYLVTDHINFYERYGWKFLCHVKCDHDTCLSRIYVHD